MRSDFLVWSVLALCCGGCASSPEKQLRREEIADSRRVEERRMREATSGEAAGSSRWAEVLVVNKHKSFDGGGDAAGSRRTARSGQARTKEFHFEQRYTPAQFHTRDFRGTKDAWMGNYVYSTKEANTRGKYGIPNATREAPTKTAATKEAWDAGKKVATRDLPGGNRQYLGPEANPRGQTRVSQLGPAAQGDPNVGWRGDAMKQLTVEDIRELLNKNK